jgi:hypothetical protein
LSYYIIDVGFDEQENEMSCYQDNYFAAVVQRRVFRAGGWDEICVVPYSGPNHYGPDGRAMALHEGAGYYCHVAPGFEYALDAPVFMPAGSMQAAAFQPYSD